MLFRKIQIKNAKLERPIVNITVYKDFSTSVEKYYKNFIGFIADKNIAFVDCKNYKIKIKDDFSRETFYMEGKNLTFSDGVNLKITDLSFYLANIKSSGNSIYLKLKDKSAEFDALIHTSENDIAKITGKYDFRKKHYIDLDANAKNINLANLFNIINKMSKIFNIKNSLNEMKISGLLNADFNLKSDFKELKSKGKIELINAVCSHKSLPYSLSNINAFVNFDNNEIKLEKAQVLINNTPVKMEGFIKNNLTVDLKAYSDDLDLKTLFYTFLNKKQIPFDIKNGIVSFTSEIKGNLAKNYNIKSLVNIKNFDFADIYSKIPISVQNLAIDFIVDKNGFKGHTKIQNMDLSYKNNNIKLPELVLNFDNKDINILKTKVFLINSPFEIEGLISNYTNNPKGKLSFIGNINSDNAADIIVDYIKIPYKAQGKLYSKGTIQLENEKIKLNTQIKSDKDNYISYVVVKELLNKPSFTNINIEFYKNLLTIKDISITDEKEQKIKISGQIETGKDLIFNDINLIIPNAVTINSNFLGGEEISLKADLTLNNSLKNPIIEGNSKILKYNLKKYLTSIKNADINFSPKNIKITAPDITVNNSLFNINADIIPDIKNITVSNLKLNSMNLDVNSLFGIIQELKTIKKYPVIKNGSAAINNFKLSNLKARDIISDFSLDKNILKISNINANAYNGLVKGNAAYEISTGILDIDMEGKELNIKTSLYDLCNLDDDISGQTDVKAKISLLTGPYNTVIKTLSGEMNFNAKNGSMGTLGKFEYYLYAQNLMSHGLINATLNRIAQTIKHNDTSHYKTAEGKILFKQGYMIADNIHTQGENMSLFVKGKHNILTNQTNIDIYGRISDEITEKMGKYGDISISDIINGEKTPKQNFVMMLPSSDINEIKSLYGKEHIQTKTFKVSMTGNIKAINAINSFNWIIDSKTLVKNEEPEIEKTEEEENYNLPDFADL